MNQELYTNLKRRLSTRQNKFCKARAVYLDRKSRENVDALKAAAHQLEKEAEYGLAQFAEHGYPDQWCRWEVAKNDAESTARYAEVTCFH
jgi:hypothetical protein